MEELFTNPLFQSGILPFSIALIGAFLLRPLGWRWAGLGFAIAFATATYFIVGFQITPFTSTRKIILLTAIAVVLGLLIDIVPHKLQRYVPLLIAGLSAAAVAWLIWPVVKRLDGQAYWLMLAGSIAYGMWLITWTESLRTQASRATATALALGLGSSISAVLGASALLGQLGGVVAASASAFILLFILNRPLALGSSFILPVAVATALISISAVIYAGLNVYALIPLALIPLFARLPVKQDWHATLKIIVICLYTLPPAAAAIYITSQTAGESLY